MEGGREVRDARWDSPAALFNQPARHQSPHMRTQGRCASADGGGKASAVSSRGPPRRVATRETDAREIQGGALSDGSARSSRWPPALHERCNRSLGRRAQHLETQREGRVRREMP